MPSPLVCIYLQAVVLHRKCLFLHCSAVFFKVSGGAKLFCHELMLLWLIFLGCVLGSNKKDIWWWGQHSGRLTERGFWCFVICVETFSDYTCVKLYWHPLFIQILLELNISFSVFFKNIFILFDDSTLCLCLMSPLHTCLFELWLY